MTSPPKNGSALGRDSEGTSKATTTPPASPHTQAPSSGSAPLPPQVLAIELAKDPILLQIERARLAIRAWRGRDGERVLSYGGIIRISNRNTLLGARNRLKVILCEMIRFTRNGRPAWPPRELVIFLEENGETIEPEGGA